MKLKFLKPLLSLLQNSQYKVPEMPPYPSAQPILQSTRLTLRPFQPQDAPRVQLLAGDIDIASTTLTIPHPYTDGLAEQWIASLEADFHNQEQIVYAMISHAEKAMIGAIGLNLELSHDRGEMGYWVGKPYWNRGYCSEAAQRLLTFVFAELGLQRIYCHHLLRNPASGRVMRKLGMHYEGRLRQHIKKWGIYEDLELYGMLASEFALNKDEGISGDQQPDVVSQS